MHLILVLSILGMPQAVQATFPFARDLQSALKEAADRQVPILYCNFDSWKGHPLDPVLNDTTLASTVAKVVCVLSSNAKHGDAEQEIDGATVKVCKQFGWTPCSAHKAVLDHVFRSFAQNGVLEFPHFYLASHDGTLLFSLFGEKSAQALDTEIENALGQAKPGMDRATWLRCRKAFAEVDAAEKSGDLLAAHESLTSIQKLAKGFPPADEALNAMMHLNDLGRERKNQIEAKLGQEDRLTSLIALDDLAVALGDLAAADQTRAALEQALAKSDFAKLKPDLEKHRSARTLYYKGMQLVSEGKRDPARRTLTDLTKRFPGSAFEGRAQKVLADLLKAPKKP